jgi:hypothetical protein
MAVAQEKTVPMNSPAVEEILHWLRSEPALAWFAAQALWTAQPMLEIFWAPENISAFAETLETMNSHSGKTPAGSGEGGT